MTLQVGASLQGPERFAGDRKSQETACTTAKAPRIVSLDIFRGLNIALMIFVNELAGIGGLPWWTHHAAANANGMTYVDMVYPGFLIIVGMSLPLALRARVRHGDGTLRLAWYVVLRAAALLVFGLILENGPQGDAARMHGLGGFAWTLLALLAAFLVWFDYPQAVSPQRGALRESLHGALRVCGLVLLVALTVVYRRVDPASHRVAWLTFVYPEILGLIGYTYLVAGLCYLATRRWLWAPLGWFTAFVALNILTAAKVVVINRPWWVWPAENGAQPGLVFAGIVLSTFFFFEPRCRTFARKAVPVLAFGVAAAVGAWLLTPLGISKNAGTPTWMLYTVAACCAIYSALYFVCDVTMWTRWATPVRSAGSNTLLTYLLPDIWYFAISAAGVEWFSRHLRYGVAGALRAAVFTLLMLAVSAWLTRWRFRLQL